MDLFENSIDNTKNWLPQDGTVNYYGKVINKQQADHYLEKLLATIEWKNDEAVIFGKKSLPNEKWLGMATSYLNTLIPTQQNMLCCGQKNC